jgi:N-acyl-D-glutamate deacylase
MKYLASLLAFAVSLLFFAVDGMRCATGQEYDIVINGGRVIDPESNLDAVRHLGIKDGQIAIVSESPLNGQKVVNAKGLIVAPGFIDFHAHGQNIASDRMQAFDGVTTALELESGILPIGEWYANQEKARRVVNYGASAAWTYARVSALENLEPEPTLFWFQDAYALTHWVNDVATEDQQKRILEMIEQGVKEGSIGVGLNSGYAPGYGYKEVLAVHQLAAKYGVPTFTHIRNLSRVDPGSSIQAYGELISFATGAGSHVHVCHLNSTSLTDITIAARILRDAQKRGAKITVEAYPYGAGSGAVNAAMFQPANMKRMDAKPEDIEYLGKPLTAEKLRKMQKETPGEIIVWHYFRLPRDQHLLDAAVLYPGGIIASDAMPWLSKEDGNVIDGDVWPLPDTAFAHPRTAATFVKFLVDYVRDRKAETLSEGIARCSLRPAKILEESVPQMKRKGRIQVGMDADIIVFDLDKLEVRATYTEPNQHTIGMQHVLVGGTPVIEDGKLDQQAFPGQAVRRPVSE